MANSIITYLKVLIVSICILFAPAKTMCATALVLCLLDLALGIAASKRAGSSITSFGLKRTVMKILVYELALLVSYLVGAYLTQGVIPTLNIASSMIGLTELKSILENLDLIAGKPVLKSILDALQNGSSNAPPPSEPPPPPPAA